MRAVKDALVVASAAGYCLAELSVQGATASGSLGCKTDLFDLPSNQRCAVRVSTVVRRRSESRTAEGDLVLLEEPPPPLRAPSV
mmetsp:Transcript_39304/g.103651  ORF Transcript_39304/g.103651 Transcript_39304/m.103651 type:complete len:84 (+) Transcript_39304:1624-1875(+)